MSEDLSFQSRVKQRAKDLAASDEEYHKIMLVVEYLLHELAGEFSCQGRIVTAHLEQEVLSGNLKLSSTKA